VLHQVRDCRVRKGNGTQIMASLQNLAISLLRMAGAAISLHARCSSVPAWAEISYASSVWHF